MIFSPPPPLAQDHASKAMEVFNELIDSEVSVIIPHVADIISFCLEVRTDARWQIRSYHFSFAVTV